MQDHIIPTVDTLEKCASIVQDELKSGKNLVVHCLAGEGRTGCVLAAYLVKERGISADEALRELRRIKPAFVEPSQEKAIYEFASKNSTG